MLGIVGEDLGYRVPLPPSRRRVVGETRLRVRDFDTQRAVKKALGLRTTRRRFRS